MWTNRTSSTQRLSLSQAAAAAVALEKREEPGANSARLGSARFSRTSRCTRTLHATRRRVSTPPSSLFERVSLCQNATRRWRVVISAQPAAVLLSPFVKHVSPGCTSERSKKVFAAGGLARTLFALILNMLNKCIRLFCAHHRVVTFVVCLG